MREGFDMKKNQHSAAPRSADVVFRQAITPLEASVLPAIEKGSYGTLRMIRYAREAGRDEARAAGNQRAKIWVR